MPDEDKDIIDDEGVDGEQTPTTDEQPDVKTLQAQKAHWREKAKKLEEEKKELLAKIPPEKPVQVAEKPAEAKQDDSEWKRKIEFTVNHKEYDSEDINKLLVLSKGLGVDLEKAAEDPLFKSYYNAKQEEASKAGTTPPASRSPKVAPPKPVKDMTEEEHRAYFEGLL